MLTDAEQSSSSQFLQFPLSKKTYSYRIAQTISLPFDSSEPQQHISLLTLLDWKDLDSHANPNKRHLIYFTNSQFSEFRFVTYLERSAN